LLVNQCGLPSALTLVYSLGGDHVIQSHCSYSARESACPGWIVDHVQALKHGGADAPVNMQWQTRAEAKAKDKIE